MKTEFIALVSGNVTNGGGIGVLAADKCNALRSSSNGRFQRDTKNEFWKLPLGSMRNPIDLTANANNNMYHKILGTTDGQ